MSTLQGDKSGAQGSVSQGKKDSNWEMNKGSPRAPQNDSDSDSGTRAKRDKTEKLTDKPMEVAAPEGAPVNVTEGSQLEDQPPPPPPPPPPAGKPSNDSSSDSGMKF